MTLVKILDPVTGDLMVDILSTVSPFLLNQTVLKLGYVKVLDCMPRLVPADQYPSGDFALADAARMSYQKGTRKVSSDAGLIDHLIRNAHSSPVEQAELKYGLRMPLFICAQHLRHRTAGANQESARYSVIEDDFYIPEPQHWAINTSKDKQATEQLTLDPRVADKLHSYIHKHCEEAYELYKSLMTDGAETDAEGEFFVPGIAREQARMILSQNIFSRMVWKQDLRNHLHYLSLRTDKHAQFEIREYANAMAKVVATLFPATWASYKDNVIDGVSFSKTEFSVIHAFLSDECIGKGKLTELGWTGRRVTEFLAKTEKAGFNFKA